jgi:3-phenylpropionate/trans-cinnamate dioxygenase ferredoxin reductase subunit
MRKKLTIVANGQPFSAYPGDMLLDAALLQGIDLTHDCRAGQCGSCLVRVLGGEFLGGQTNQPNLIQACQARVFSDAQISYEKMPPPRRLPGKLALVQNLSAEVLGLTIKLDEPSNHLPGQYYKFAFRGFPARCYSPAAPFAGRPNKNMLPLHVKIVRNGKVSANIGNIIRPGHAVTAEGPFGSAFLRPEAKRRLVLVASGTGFAPIWAIAEASVRIQPNRPLLLVVGARRLSALYMIPALRQLAEHPATLIVTLQEPQTASPYARLGTPIQHLPPLAATDVVYAAGSPALVAAVGSAASASGAEFYADPFTASGGSERPWLALRLPKAGGELKSRLLDWLVKQARKEKALWQSDWDGDLFASAEPGRPTAARRASPTVDFIGQLDAWRP